MAMLWRCLQELRAMHGSESEGGAMPGEADPHEGGIGARHHQVHQDPVVGSGATATRNKKALQPRVAIESGVFEVEVGHLK